MKKKISLPIVITVALLAAAIAFSAAFIIARASFNSELHQLSEKQALFGNCYSYLGNPAYEAFFRYIGSLLRSLYNCGDSSISRASYSLPSTSTLR